MRNLVKYLAAVSLTVIAISAGTVSVKAEGWVQQPNGYYYVYDDGTIATNTQIGIFSIDSTGLVTVDQAVNTTNQIIALQQVQQQALLAEQSKPVAKAPTVIAGDLATVCSNIAGPVAASDKTDSEKIRALFDYMIASTSYKRDYTTPTGNFGPAYAYECLTTHTGNCYRYASAFAYLLKAAGYESRIAYGQIHAARGGLTPHSWTEININGVWYTCDCEMQDAKGTKYNFFLIPFENYPIKPLVAQGYLPVSF